MAWTPPFAVSDAPYFAACLQPHKRAASMTEVGQPGRPMVWRTGSSASGRSNDSAYGTN